MKAYTYLIGWSQHNKWYYGVRFSKKCSINELWETYFTSSKYVHKFANEHGRPDIIQIRRTFNNVNSARKWESKVLRKLKAVQRNDFLNQTDNISISKKAALKGAASKKPIGFAKGANNSMFGTKRPDLVLYNKTRVHPFKGKKRNKHSLLMKNNNPMKGTYGLYFWTNEKITKRSYKKPGKKWRRGRAPKNQTPL